MWTPAISFASHPSNGAWSPQRVLSGRTIYGWLFASESRWECNQRGVAAPIELRLELWEDDPCSAALGCFNPYVPAVIDPEDDIIGRAVARYDAAELASRLPDVGDVTADQFTLGGPCGHQEPGHVCGAGPFTSTGPEYDLTINIRRVSDALPRHG